MMTSTPVHDEKYLFGESSVLYCYFKLRCEIRLPCSNNSDMMTVYV